MSVLQIRSEFTDKLLKIVCDPSLHMKQKSQGDNKTPSGDLHSQIKRHKGDYALEFIKPLCAVLLLDQKVHHEVLVCLLLKSKP